MPPDEDSFVLRKTSKMIQRIQSVFLLIMALSMSVMLFVPIWIKGNPDTEEFVVLNAFNLTHTKGLVQETVAQSSSFYIALLVILSASVSLFSIFLFKKRLLQMKLGALNSLLGMGAVLTSLYFTNKGAELLSPQIAGEYKLGFFVPIIALVFNSLANRFIKRDEKLVQSANRMR